MTGTANLVCSECAPFNCERCDEVTTQAFRRSRSSFTLDAQALQVMGPVQPNRRQCKGCGKTKELGTSELCFECARRALPTSELVCSNCLHLEEDWYYARHDKCTTCGKTSPVDFSGICRDCFNQHKLHRRRCFNCLGYFTPTMKGETHCALCKVHCYGCGERFSPKSKLHSFCSKCTTKLSKNVCLKCGARGRKLDKLGKCPACRLVENSPVLWCRVCDVNQVDGPEELCKMCYNRSRLCPMCLNKSIYDAEFLCSTCKKTIEDG